MRDRDERLAFRRGAVDAAPSERQAVIAAHRRGELCEHQTEAQLLLLEHQTLLERVDVFLEYPGPRGFIALDPGEDKAARAITLKIRNLMGKAKARRRALNARADMSAAFRGTR